VLERNLDQLGRQALRAEIREGERGESVRGEQRRLTLVESAVRAADDQHSRPRRLISGREERADQASLVNGLAREPGADEAALDPASLARRAIGRGAQLDVERHRWAREPQRRCASGIALERPQEPECARLLDGNRPIFGPGRAPAGAPPERGRAVATFTTPAPSAS